MKNLFVKLLEDLKPNELAQHYSLGVMCGNCGKYQKVYLQKGVKKFGKMFDCENCGCIVNL